MSPLPTNDMLALMMSRQGAVAPIGILDVLALDGTSHHWATYPIASAAALGITPLFTGNPPAWNAAHLGIANWDDTYLPWLLQAGPFHLSRSMQSNIGNFLIQNVSGDSIARDMSTLITASTFEGAVFGYREWNLEAQLPEFEFHGRLTITAVTETSAEFGAEQLFNPSNYQALEVYSEQCRWRYASAACGDATNNPCQNSFETCRQPSRFAGVLNTFTIAPTPSVAQVSTRMTVRRRQT